MLLQGAISGLFMAIAAILYVQIRDWFALQQALNASLVNPVVAKKEDTFQHKRNFYSKDKYKKARKEYFSKSTKEHLEKTYQKLKSDYLQKPPTEIKMLDFEAIGSILGKSSSDITFK